MNLKYGSQGDEVKKLQQQLNKNGYSLSEDGIFGANTDAAVRDYQTKNGLASDGIVGVQTRQKLEGGSGGKTVSGVSQETAAGMQTGYQPNEAVREAQTRYEAVSAAKPSFTADDTWLREAYDAVRQQAPFRYDAESDPLYVQYRTQLERQGSAAMRDTMGQAAGLTGGYGSTYAQTAGQQAYDRYLDTLGDRLPALYEAAYGRYQDRQDALSQQYEAARAQYDADYGRYRDELRDWNDERGAALDEAQDARDFSYREYRDLLDYWLQQAKLENEDYRWQREYALKLAGL